MKRILSFLMAVMLGGALFAQSIEVAEPDFSAVCPSRQTLYYSIQDGAEVYLCLGPNAAELLGGHIQVPRTVKHDGRTYMVTGVADGAFAECVRIQGITLPTSVYMVGEKSFYRCTDLRVVLLPKSLTSIGAQAFEGCTSLLDVVMPHSVVELGEYAFKDCSQVRQFVISNSLDSIPEGAFMNCSDVTDYIVPASVKALGCRAFDGYKSLKSIMFLGNPPVQLCPEPVGREVKIYVAKPAFDAFKASYQWGQYQIQVL